jgi:hypothetical protein
MSRWTRVGLVGAGYLLAFAAGGVAGHMYDVRVSALPYDTSGGMYAGGEFMTAFGTFLVVALVPTLLALWFLRGQTRLWQAVALASLAFAAAGLIAVLMPLVTHDTTRNPALLLFSLVGLAQLLGMPLWTAAFVLFAFLAPTRRARKLMIAAIGIELVIGACAAIHWFLPRPPL